MIYGIPVCSSKQIVRCKYIAKRYPEESIARWGVRRLHVSTCVPDVFRKRVAVLKRTRHPCNRCAIVSIFNCIKFHPRVRFKIYPFHFSSSSFFFFTRFRLRATTTHWLEKGHFFPNSNTFFFFRSYWRLTPQEKLSNNENDFGISIPWRKIVWRRDPYSIARIFLARENIDIYIYIADAYTREKIKFHA